MMIDSPVDLEAEDCQKRELFTLILYEIDGAYCN